MPTSNKVEITFTSNDRDLIRSLQKQNDQYEKQIRKLEQVNMKSRRSTQTQVQGLNSVASMATKATLAVGMIGTALVKVASLNAQLKKDAHEAAVEWEQLGKAIQVQGGLTDLQRDSAQKRVWQAAYTMAVPLEVANSTATQLVSSGFSIDEATGGSLLSSLATMKANNATGNATSSAELVKSMAKFLSANGLDKNAENLNRVGQNVFGLFQSTDLQLSDLASLSKKAGVLKNGLSVEDQLAGQATLVSASLPSDNASEALGQIVLRLGATKGDKTVEKNLAKLGLNPEDVDLVGESFSEVLDKFATGLGGLEEKDRASVLRGIFGDSAISPFGILVDQRNEFNKNLDRQRDTSGYGRAVDVATSGRKAGQTRQELEGKDTDKEFVDDSKVIGDQITIESKKNSTTGFTGVIQRGMGDAQRLLYGSLVNFGLKPADALKIAMSPIDLGTLNPNEKLHYQNVMGGAMRHLKPASAQGDETYNAQLETNRLLQNLVEKTDKVEANTRNTEANTKQKPSRQIKRNED
ncbi:MAG: hypothetical protein CMJ47_02840 [Planctomyces sp.]|nr:hypothetical protein [Planctomyces sp.]